MVGKKSEDKISKISSTLENVETELLEMIDADVTMGFKPSPQLEAAYCFVKAALSCLRKLR